MRLPFDYNIILDENGNVLESGLKLLERCADWCRAHGLNIILDLHKTMGFSFDKGEQESGFFENQRYQDIFVNLWSRIAKRFGNRNDVSYPGPTKEYYEKSLEFIGPDLAQAYENYPIDIVDRRFMEAEMQVAADVGKKMNVPVYCGEYGVIDKVGGADLLRWYDDIHAVFDKFGFGRAAWNYKEKDFGIIDECRADIADEIVKHLKR